MLKNLEPRNHDQPPRSPREHIETGSVPLEKLWHYGMTSLIVPQLYHGPRA